MASAVTITPDAPSVTIKPDAASPTDALSKATGLSAGPSWLGQKWNEIKSGLTAAQEGGGLKPQPTFLGNAAEGAGMLGSLISQYGTAEGLPAEARQVADAVPAMPAARLAKASDAFNQVRTAVGEIPVQMTDAMKTALDSLKETTDLVGGPTIANKVMGRMTNAEESPLSYDEGRQLYHSLGDLTTSDKLASNKNMLRLLNQFRSALGDSIQSTVGQAGQAEGQAGTLATYTGAMKDWASASQAQERLDKIITWAKGIGLSALGTGAVRKAWDLYGKLYGDK
jgi:hypothetical protein